MAIYDERFHVRNDEVVRALRAMAQKLEEDLPDGWAFGLFLAPMGEHEAAPKGHGSVFWISNADRAGMIDCVKGWIADNERRSARTSDTGETR